jgi:hypothetical protein
VPPQSTLCTVPPGTLGTTQCASTSAPPDGRGTRPRRRGRFSAVTAPRCRASRWRARGSRGGRVTASTIGRPSVAAATLGGGAAGRRRAAKPAPRCRGGNGDCAGRRVKEEGADGQGGAPAARDPAVEPKGPRGAATSSTACGAHRRRAGGRGGGVGAATGSADHTGGRGTAAMATAELGASARWDGSTVGCRPTG